MYGKIGLLLTALLILLIAAVSCGTDSSTNNTSPIYSPVTVGDKWTYNIDTTLGSNNYAYSQTAEIISVNQSNYSMKLTTSGSTDYTIHDYVFSNNTWGESLITSYHNGVGTIFFSCSPPSYNIPLSSSIGTSETYTSTCTMNTTGTPTTGTSSTTYTITGIELLTVPAGTFDNCLKVEAITSGGSSTLTSYSWYAPNVGLIKNLVTSVSSSMEMDMQLISFSVH